MAPLATRLYGTLASVRKLTHVTFEAFAPRAATLVATAIFLQFGGAGLPQSSAMTLCRLHDRRRLTLLRRLLVACRKRNCASSKDGENSLGIHPADSRTLNCFQLSPAVWCGNGGRYWD